MDNDFGFPCEKAPKIQRQWQSAFRNASAGATARPCVSSQEALWRWQCARPTLATGSRSRTMAMTQRHAIPPWRFELPTLDDAWPATDHRWAPMLGTLLQYKSYICLACQTTSRATFSHRRHQKHTCAQLSYMVILFPTGYRSLFWAFFRPCAKIILFIFKKKNTFCLLHFLRSQATRTRSVVEWLARLHVSVRTGVENHNFVRNESILLTATNEGCGDYFVL